QAPQGLSHRRAAARKTRRQLPLRGQPRAARDPLGDDLLEEDVEDLIDRGGGGVGDGGAISHGDGGDVRVSGQTTWSDQLRAQGITPLFASRKPHVGASVSHIARDLVAYSAPSGA